MEEQRDGHNKHTHHHQTNSSGEVEGRCMTSQSEGMSLVHRDVGHRVCCLTCVVSLLVFGCAESDKRSC